jgi:hypothetical protein
VIWKIHQFPCGRARGNHGRFVGTIEAATAQEALDAALRDPVLSRHRPLIVGDVVRAAKRTTNPLIPKNSP